MQAYKIETTVTRDGKIILPPKLNNIFNHKVEVVVLDKEISSNKKSKLNIPTYKCGGKLADFSREEIFKKAFKAESGK